MNARHPVLRLMICSTIGLLVVACSKDEPETSASATPPPTQLAATPGAAKTKPVAEEPLGSGDAVGLAAEFARQCGGDAAPSRDCEILRSLLVVEVATALEEIGRSRDQRGTAEALAALELADEPEILVAACRILGQFPDTPGIAEKALPLLLESPYLQVQLAAADLLISTPDAAIAAVGGLWRGNHNTLPTPANEYAEYPDYPAHYAGMKFPEYPGAEWFSPADSDRSIGWSTSDDAATVARWFGEALSAEPIGYQRWLEEQSRRAMVPFQSIDQGKLDRIQQLIEQYVQTQDVALMQQVERLQEEAYAPVKEADAAAELVVDKVVIPPGSVAPDEVRYIVAEETSGRIARVVLVYPLPGVQRTVIQTAWNLGDYPSAWPAAADRTQ
jgi:hypothetical protein